MKYRSWLIVPGNSEERLGAAMASGADVVVVDLEESVPEAEKGIARRMGREWLEAHRHSVLEQRRFQRWVRINPLQSGWSHEDLSQVMQAVPDGIIVPKATGHDTVRQIAAEIYEFEQRCQVRANSTRVMPVIGETPDAAMSISSHLQMGHQRLAGLTWNPAALARAMGAHRTQDETGWSDPMRFVRAQTLLTALAGEIMAIEAPLSGFEDPMETTAAARAAHADGFTGMFALHPEQVAPINRAFAPSPEDLAQAREIVSAFAESPQTGSLPVGGHMVDHAQLAIAQRIVADADEGRHEPRRMPILRPA